MCRTVVRRAVRHVANMTISRQPRVGGLELNVLGEHRRASIERRLSRAVTPTAPEFTAEGRTTLLKCDWIRLLPRHERMRVADILRRILESVHSAMTRNSLVRDQFASCVFLLQRTLLRPIIHKVRPCRRRLLHDAKAPMLKHSLVLVSNQVGKVSQQVLLDKL